MRWFGALLALLLVPALTGPAPAQVKSIMRFEKDSTATPDKDEAAGEEGQDAADRVGGTPQGSAGSTRQGTLVEEGEEGAIDSGTPGLPDPFGLPGQPAALAPPGAQAPAAVGAPALPEAPRLVAPTLPERRPVRPTGVARDSRTAAPEGIGPRPEAPKPFTYERAPVAVGTWSGYDAAVAPEPVLADPAVPANLGTGRPGAVQRPLPRLAPYGYALPPGESTPPVARPRW